MRNKKSSPTPAIAGVVFLAATTLRAQRPCCASEASLGSSLTFDIWHDLSLTRDAATGAIASTSLGNIATSHSLTPFGELQNISAPVAGAAVFSNDLIYDKAGRILEKMEIIQGQPDRYAYSYDQTGRLIQVSKNGAPISSYSYDANGNRLSAGAYLGTYDAQDRLLQYGIATYAHSANGEWVSKSEAGQTTGYAYDVYGNLKTVTLPNASVIEYLTDGQNRRIGKKVNGAIVQGFLYQDQLKPIAELDGQGNTIARFVYGEKPNVPEYMTRGADTYRIVTDHLGSPRLIINSATGAIAQRVDYDEFGNITLDSNPGFQPFGFAGGMYDQHTKLTRFGARDYDAHTGKWTTKDPIRFNGGDANLYAYVGGNPILHRDPSGLAPSWWPWGSDPINSRSGPIDQSGRVPRTGNPIDGPYKAPTTWGDWVTNKIGDQIGKWVTGVPGLVTKNPLTILIGLSTYSSDLGGCDENGICQDMMPLYIPPKPQDPVWCDKK